MTALASSELSVMHAFNNLERFVLFPGTTKMYVNVPTNNAIMIIDNIVSNIITTHSPYHKKSYLYAILYCF